MEQVAEVRFVRVQQICGDRKRGIPAILPLCRATWYAGVKSGRFPKGCLLSPGIRVWRIAEVISLIDSINAAAH